MMDFFRTCRQFLFGAAIYNVHVGTQAHSRARSIHGHVATAYHCYFLSDKVRCLVFFLVGKQQVVTGQKLVGGNHTTQIFARNIQKVGESGTRAQKHGIETPFIQKVVHGNGAANHHIAFEAHTQFLHIFHFVLHHGLFRQTEGGDSIYQYAAKFMQRFENRYIVALHAQFLGAGQT